MAALKIHPQESIVDHLGERLDIYGFHRRIRNHLEEVGGDPLRRKPPREDLAEKKTFCIFFSAKQARVFSLARFFRKV